MSKSGGGVAYEGREEIRLGREGGRVWGMCGAGVVVLVFVVTSISVILLSLRRARAPSFVWERPLGALGGFRPEAVGTERAARRPNAHPIRYTMDQHPLPAQHRPAKPCRPLADEDVEVVKHGCAGRSSAG